MAPFRGSHRRDVFRGPSTSIRQGSCWPGGNARGPRSAPDTSTLTSRVPRDTWDGADVEHLGGARESNAVGDRMNNRRKFLMALGGVLALPRFALAQPAERTYRIGWLGSTGRQTEPYNIAFEQRLRELGFAEGRNLVIEFRGTAGRSGTPALRRPGRWCRGRPRLDDVLVRRCAGARRGVRLDSPATVLKQGAPCG